MAYTSNLGVVPSTTPQTSTVDPKDQTGPIEQVGKTVSETVSEIFTGKPPSTQTLEQRAPDLQRSPYNASRLITSMVVVAGIVGVGLLGWTLLRRR